MDVIVVILYMNKNYEMRIGSIRTQLQQVRHSHNLHLHSYHYDDRGRCVLLGINAARGIAARSAPSRAPTALRNRISTTSECFSFSLPFFYLEVQICFTVG